MMQISNDMDLQQQVPIAGAVAVKEEEGNAVSGSLILTAVENTFHVANQSFAHQADCRANGSRSPPTHSSGNAPFPGRAADILSPVAEEIGRRPAADEL